MFVLHLTGWPIPETTGGTEVYVTSLSRALFARGVRAEVGCLAPDQRGQAGDHDGVRVHRIAPPDPDPDGFRAWLDGLRPDIVHVHAVTEGLGPAAVATAAQAGYPVVLTVHVPSVPCRRGTMMRYGRTPCDGEMRPTRCSACYLQGRGLPVSAAWALASAPAAVRQGLARVAPPRAATALRLKDTLRRDASATRRMFADCRRVVAVCQWLYDALRVNGIPADKLVLSRQATDPPPAPPPRPTRPPGRPLVVGYIGRYEEIKGVDVLVESATGLPPAVPVRFVLRGTADGYGGTAYRDRLRGLAGGDPRIDLGGRLSRAELPSFLAGIDVLAVPSTWLETGPIVVYEALAHRVPVLGSRLGGIAELVRDGTDGWLLPAGDVRAWRAKLAALAVPGAPLPEVPFPHPAVRTWDQAAGEMAAVYRAVLAGDRA